MRIASLLPSATEIVYALDRGDDLVAVTHECDYPPAARDKPAVTRSLLPPGLSNAHIDRLVRETARDAHTIYELDAERLCDFRPDAVLTQSLCEVCAVPRSEVDAAVCTMPQQAQVVSLDPHTLEDVLTSIVVTGEALGAGDRAKRVVEGLRRRIERVRSAVAGATERPRVFCAEWLDPLFCGGHWVPELVHLAGGDDGLGREGQPSVEVTWEAVLRFQPEVIIAMPCGFDAAQTLERLGDLTSRAGWDRVPAVQSGRVYAVNGSAYFSRPGPRLIDGLELLARIMHPDRVQAPVLDDAAFQISEATEPGTSSWRAEPVR